MWVVACGAFTVLACWTAAWRRTPRFDLCIGVSAGSANMTSYLAGQHGRNKPFYDEYSFRRVHERAQPHPQALLSRSGLMSTAPSAMQAARIRLITRRLPAARQSVAVAAGAGERRGAAFHQAQTPPDDYRVLMASCCIPVIDPALRHRTACLILMAALPTLSRPEWAFAHGCDRVALHPDCFHRAGEQ